MHKGFEQIKKVIPALFIVVAFMPVWVMGQARIEEPRLIQIQRAFHRGEINVDQAVLEQYRVLYEPSNRYSEERQVEKCATPAHMFFNQHKQELSPETLNKVERYQAEKVESSSQQSQQSYISPSGLFEIIYYTSGNDSVSVTDNDGNGVPDYIDHVAESADSSYNHQVNNIGYPNPVPGGETYKVYVKNLVYYYGETGSSSGTTFINIENDFVGFSGNTHPKGDQVGAVYATMAHEFKHAIQYVQDGWSGNSSLWLEMDATLMEEVVYDDVNDYYNYLFGFSGNLFTSPSVSLIPGSYEDVTWAIYFEERVGPDFWVDVWERLEAQPFMQFLTAIENELTVKGFDINEEVVRSYLWHFASGSRSGGDDYGFTEKESYPSVDLNASFNAVPEAKVALNSLNRFSSRYVEVVPSLNDIGRINAAIDFDSTQVGLGLLFYLKTGETREMIALGENKGQVYLPSDIDWADINKLGIVVNNFSSTSSTDGLKLQLGKNGNPVNIKDPAYADLPNAIKVFQNYPNPFNPVTNISFEIPRPAFVTLEVFDITGRKVQTLVNGNLDVKADPYIITFNGSELSSGVYIYRLSIDDLVVTKKMTLVK